MKVLTYKKFKDEIISRLKEYYGDSAEIDVIKVLKNNSKKMEAINIVFEGIVNQTIPLLYLENYYESYKQGELTIAQAVDKIITIRGNVIDDDPVVEDMNKLMSSWDRVKELIYPQVINTADNQELLNDLVSYEFLDLSVIFVVYSSIYDDGVGCIKITKELFNHYGITIDELKEQALKNLKKENYHFESMNDVISRLMGIDNTQSEDNTEDFIPGNMYVLTNDKGLFGAAGLLCEDLLRERLQDKSTVIIPSSIHELIFFPLTPDIKLDDITETIRSVNECAVKLQDRLSDHAYLYDGSIHKVISA